jgi:phage tail sheath protein FI
MTSFTYPGVYIQELPSAVHTITGVATSIAAFVGWAPMGPTDKAVLVQSWSEYQRLFGGLYPNVYLGYAVNQFFGNGGSQAYIVRIVDTTSGTLATASLGTEIGGLTLYASSPGKWGNSIQVSLTLSPADASRFSILVQQATTTGSTTTYTTLENFTNLSFNPADPQGNYVVAVIDNDSSYLTFVDPLTGAPPSGPPSGSPAALTGTPLGASGGGTNGADGDVLYPTVGSTGAFETALNIGGAAGSGIPLLDGVFFNLLVVPGMTDAPTISKLQTFCQLPDNRAFYIVDAPQDATISKLGTSGPAGSSAGAITTEPESSNSAYYFPWVSAPDPLAGNRPALFPPSGFVAGVYAATDASRGVWKAPAGLGAGLSGISGLQYTLSDSQNGTLNTQAINCLRTFPVYGTVVWGARTLDGNNDVGSEWMYVNIRRFALFLESSLYHSTQWAVFEPNDDTLWGQLRLDIGAFMQGLFQQGAFPGTTPQQAYFVKCDSENNPQSSIAQGIVNVLVGFAPLYPAEFVVIQIQQMAGQASS